MKRPVELYQMLLDLFWDHCRWLQELHIFWFHSYGLSSMTGSPKAHLCSPVNDLKNVRRNKISCIYLLKLVSMRLSVSAHYSICLRLCLQFKSAMTLIFFITKIINSDFAFFFFSLCRLVSSKIHERPFGDAIHRIIYSLMYKAPADIEYAEYQGLSIILSCKEFIVISYNTNPPDNPFQQCMHVPVRDQLLKTNIYVLIRLTQIAFPVEAIN